jgi:DNA-binding transcriptional LysR family regulator
MRRGVDIENVRTFLEVVRTGSFVNAAANLNVTQTAVSARIRVLEETLQRPLFSRNKAGARLTPEGEQFQRFATTLVQVWERARHSVALPPGRETVVNLGAELGLWTPLLKNWLLWMRTECPEIAVRAHIGVERHLMDEVERGVLDVAVLYAAPRRPHLICELLFAEQLVMVRAADAQGPPDADRYTHVEWGEDFVENFHSAFPEQPKPAVATNYGPLALEYVLATGGSGYFRKSVVRPYVEEGRLLLTSDAPEFEFSAYAVYSTQVGEDVIARVRQGLRSAAALAL